MFLLTKLSFILPKFVTIGLLLSEIKLSTPWLVTSFLFPRRLLAELFIVSIWNIMRVRGWGSFIWISFVIFALFTIESANRSLVKNGSFPILQWVKYLHRLSIMNYSFFIAIISTLILVSALGLLNFFFACLTLLVLILFWLRIPLIFLCALKNLVDRDISATSASTS
jgi:hypothetical protein